MLCSKLRGPAASASNIHRLALFCAGLSFITRAAAHEHHMENIPEGQGTSEDPIDSVLWMHILLQSVVWGILFPTGMVLGIVRSRWHVPVQAVAACLAILGYILGHSHKGRQFAPNAHSKFAPILMLLVLIQAVCGIYLKFHLERGIHGKIRRVVVKGHGILGKLLPIAIWVQLLFGGITALGFCRGDHLGQCLAHFIMGSAFVGYGVILVILLLVGQMWLRRTGRSQEFFDSLVIAAWGCVNTFTEHRWGSPWVHNDLQHTTMGIVWWCAGLVGIWLSRRRDGSPQRNLIPSIVILLTGFAMSAHPQALPLSEKIHSIFGYTLMLAGLTRIVEISFVLRDRQTVSEDGSDPNSFQFLPPFLLFASGFIFMGATEEQIALLADYHITHVSYILILYSMAFLMFLYVNMLLYLYASYRPPVDPKTQSGVNPRMPNGHTRSADQRVRDAEEFELEGLMSDDEAEADRRKSQSEE